MDKVWVSWDLPGNCALEAGDRQRAGKVKAEEEGGGGILGAWQGPLRPDF